MLLRLNGQKKHKHQRKIYLKGKEGGGNYWSKLNARQK